MRGRKLRTNKQHLYDTLLPTLTIELPEQGGLQPASLFPSQRDYWLEIGFGGGEHLAHQATNNPTIGMIGCEPYVNGIAGLLGHIDQHKNDNIRVFTQDARLLMERLPTASFSRAYVLYPDPWPKSRHHKRRLINTEFLTALARLIKPEGELRIASDDYDYVTWILAHALPHPDFRWEAQNSTDWLKPWDDWFSTRYEQKALAAGRIPTYLTFTRL
ncbi:MAG: tRNA (guanosine(46)-N7)-methyltransferase TrmB [Rickettsiales bacterium]|nr:tRNA (guanosine(46)-N7)-methyltransferase TrmB [Rickettsiales bacterium]